jgi:hypothetical protein
VSGDAAEVEECAIVPRVFRALPLDGGEHLAHLKRALHRNDYAAADVVALVLNRHSLIIGDRPPGECQRITDADLLGSMTSTPAADAPGLKARVDVVLHVPLLPLPFCRAPGAQSPRAAGTDASPLLGRPSEAAPATGSLCHGLPRRVNHGTKMGVASPESFHPAPCDRGRCRCRKGKKAVRFLRGGRKKETAGEQLSWSI